MLAKSNGMDFKMRALSFTQIYYKDEQLPTLYEFAKPYKNEELTDYFENSVIEKVAPLENTSLIGVCSHRLRFKRTQGYAPIILKGDLSLTEEKILSKDFDVAILTPSNPLHQPLKMASNWHGKAWDDAFTVFKKFLKDDLHIRVPEELKHTIYENHFIAKRDIYYEYVSSCLSPAIEFCRSEKVFKANSGYRRKIGEDRFKEYHSKTGLADYPIAPFILERLFSIWINDRNYNVIPL